MLGKLCTLAWPSMQVRRRPPAISTEPFGSPPLEQEHLPGRCAHEDALLPVPCAAWLREGFGRVQHREPSNCCDRI